MKTSNPEPLTKYVHGSPKSVTREVNDTYVVHSGFIYDSMRASQTYPVEEVELFLAKAVPENKDKAFQLITFNSHEEKAFGETVRAYGFELIGNCNGLHNTPIYLYVLTRKPKKKKKIGD